MSDTQKYLVLSANEALERFDDGDKVGAITTFLSNMKENPATSYIAENRFTFRLLNVAYDEGREAFEKAMLGFNV